MRKRGSTEKTMTRERRELNQRRGREGKEVGIVIGQVSLFLLQATCSLRQLFLFFFF